MIGDAWTAPHLDQPQIEDAWIPQTGDDADGVDDKRRQQHPHGLEHEEQLGGQDRIADRKTIGHAQQHLRAGEADEQNVTIEAF